MKENGELISAIEALHFALNRATLFWDDDGQLPIRLDHCQNTNNPKTYYSLVVGKHLPGITINAHLKLVDSKSEVFSGLLEIIYKVRCLLVHGDLEPDSDNHEVVRQCYFLLHLLMRF
jgi:hypothetical protein